MNRIAALILAAGEASRYGGCKQLVDLNGKSILQRSIDTANEIFPESVFVVTGAYHSTVAPMIRNAEPIYYPDWKQGIGSSIAYGVHAIQDQCNAIIIMLADQIAIEASHLSAMAQCFNGSNIVCARYHGSRGVPALFCQDVFTMLKTLEGNKGAKVLLNQLDKNIIDINIPQASIDIDTPGDLTRWRALNK